MEWGLSSKDRKEKKQRKLITKVPHLVLDSGGGRRQRRLLYEHIKATLRRLCCVAFFLRIRLNFEFPPLKKL